MATKAAGMYTRRLLLLLASSVVLGSPIAYNPPSGPSPLVAQVDSKKAHAEILRRGIDVLRLDGHTQMADYFGGTSNLQWLMNGVRRADKDGGDIVIAASFPWLADSIRVLLEWAFGELKVEIPANTMSHFYNPDTGKGLQLFKDAGWYSTVISALNTFSFGPWELFTLFGPHPSATDMCDYFYAKAVDAMRKGDGEGAMTNLGIAVHYIQDMTVPQHATNRHGGYPDAYHLEYESLCDKLIEQDNIPHAKSANDLGDWYSNTSKFRPGQYIAETAKRSKSYLSAATKFWITDENAPINPKPQIYTEQFATSAAQAMIPLGEKMTAALLKRFWENWQKEEFYVVMVRIDRVEALDPNIDYGSDADFYAKVRVADKWFSTGTVVGEDDIWPQKVHPFHWFFPRWIAGRPDSVPVRIEVWDEDGGLNGPDDRVDITPVGGYALDLNYWPAGESVTRDIVQKGPDFYTKGNPTGGGDHARIWFTIESYPRSLSGEPITCLAVGHIRDVSSNPAKGAHMFFRPASNQNGKWQVLNVDEDGKWTAPILKTIEYEFRPGGSGYTFKNVPVKRLLQPGINTIDFQASLPNATQTYHPLLVTEVKLVKPEAKMSTFADVPQNVTVGTVNILSSEQAAAQEVLRQRSIEVVLPSGDYGVANNNLGYATYASYHVQLDSWINSSDKKPVSEATELKAQFTKIPGPHIPPFPPITETVLTIDGIEKGPPVANAEVEASLWLGNDLRGYREAQKLIARTGSNGRVTFFITAGSLVEDARVTFRVLSNPANPWCKPEFDPRETILFRPAKSTDDFTTFVQYRLSTPLRANELPTMTFTAASEFLDSLDSNVNPSSERMAVAFSAVDLQHLGDRVSLIRNREALLSNPRRALAEIETAAREERSKRANHPTGGHDTEPIVRPLVVEGETLVPTAIATAGRVTVQSMKTFGSQWSGGAQLLWAASAPTGRGVSWPTLTTFVEVPSSGAYGLVFHLTKAPDYGDFTVSCGTVSRSFSGYSRVVEVTTLDLGDVHLRQGRNVLTVALTGKQSNSSGYLVGLDRIEMTPKAPIWLLFWP